LYGVTKLERTAYKTEFEKCRSYFKNVESQEFDYIQKIENIMDN
jgi:hypothetical protein